MKGGGVLFLGIEGTVLAREELRILPRRETGGNRPGHPEHRVRGPTARAGRRAPRALPEAIFCLDAEGGRVIACAPSSPPPRPQRRSRTAALGRANVPGGYSARRSRAFDFDLDFAPVVDLDHGITGNALDGRAFGSTPRKVTARAKALLDGLHAAGTGGCMKHFPGLGRATADTHLRGAHIATPQADLARDLTPFTELFPDAESAMVGHAIYPGWGEQNGRQV